MWVEQVGGLNFVLYTRSFRNGVQFLVQTHSAGSDMRLFLVYFVWAASYGGDKGVHRLSARERTRTSLGLAEACAAEFRTSR